jgi:hypothetical protein
MAEEILNKEQIRRAFKRAYEWYMPKDPVWYQIVKAFSIATLFAGSVVYVIGPDYPDAGSIALFLWKTSVFRFFADTPYLCGNNSVIYCLDGQEHEGSIGLFFMALFLIGCLISMRLILLCIELFDKALRINLILRLLDKFLPAKSPPDRTGSAEHQDIDGQ